ncbi:MAG TPA: hypothetical protein VGE31_03155 [Candidatus Paceibacterota bacterium]
MNAQKTPAVSDLDPSRYPGIDLAERSNRPGVDGPRYVLTRDGQLGDTNTGRFIPAKNPPPEYSPAYARAVARADLFRQERAVQYGGE